MVLINKGRKGRWGGSLSLAIPIRPLLLDGLNFKHWNSAVHAHVEDAEGHSISNRQRLEILHALTAIRARGSLASGPDLHFAVGECVGFAALAGSAELFWCLRS